jgi:O-acetyl-ADP-ribose deacetylase (regulator of RNase III)
MLEGLVVHGDLLDQPVTAIVNAWNRNIIPWWLLVPQGVSGAMKRRAGLQPFRELARPGPMPLGSAVATSAGRLPFTAIIHGAGINMLWRASVFSIREATVNVVRAARQWESRTLAMPLIGAGSGGFDEDRACQLVCDARREAPDGVDVTVVRFGPVSKGAR